MSKHQNVLIGKAFKSLSQGLAGHITAEVATGHFLVEYFDYFSGTFLQESIIDTHHMRGWEIVSPEVLAKHFRAEAEKAGV